MNFNDVNPHLAHELGQSRLPTAKEKELIRLHNIQTLVVSLLPSMSESKTSAENIVNNAFAIAELTVDRLQAMREKVQFSE